MAKIEEKMLFPGEKEGGNFSGLIEVVDGSPNRATLEALGIEITFGWTTVKGMKKFIEISRMKEGRQSSGSMDIPKELYDALRKRAFAVTNSYAEANKAQAKKQQLNKQIKQKQPDLF
jgi:hypothetical protein